MCPTKCWSKAVNIEARQSHHLPKVASLAHVDQSRASATQNRTPQIRHCFQMQMLLVTTQVTKENVAMKPCKLGNHLLFFPCRDIGCGQHRASHAPSTFLEAPEVERKLAVVPKSSCVLCVHPGHCSCSEGSAVCLGDFSHTRTSNKSCWPDNYASLPCGNSAILGRLGKKWMRSNILSWSMAKSEMDQSGGATVQSSPFQDLQKWTRFRNALTIQQLGNISREDCSEWRILLSRQSRWLPRIRCSCNTGFRLHRFPHLPPFASTPSCKRGLTETTGNASQCASKTEASHLQSSSRRDNIEIHPHQLARGPGAKCPETALATAAIQFPAWQGCTCGPWWSPELQQATLTRFARAYASLVRHFEDVAHLWRHQRFYSPDRSAACHHHAVSASSMLKKPSSAPGLLAKIPGMLCYIYILILNKVSNL